MVLRPKLYDWLGMYIVDMIVPTNLVYVLTDPTIHILHPSISLFFILVINID